MVRKRMFQSLLSWIGLLNHRVGLLWGGMKLVSILVVLDRAPQPCDCQPMTEAQENVSILVVLDRAP